jgi:HEAT repeat protein
MALGMGLFHAQSAEMESVYNKYLQGDYLNAQTELEQIIQSNPSPEELFKMKEALGMRAVLELSQNQYLRESMQVFNSGSWQHERAQFKNPRRIKFFLRDFLEDDSTRHKSLPNLLGAGPYAVPMIVEYLKSSNDDINSRSLAYQVLMNMGSDVLPPLLACTFAKDDLLLTNVARLVAKTKSPRAVPYLLRIKETNTSKMVLDEVARSLEVLNVKEGLTSSRAYIIQANRYLSESSEVMYESVSSDGLLWDWDQESQSLVSVNAIGQEFEYHPQLPISLWPIFQAELMHQQFLGASNWSLEEQKYADAAALCTWAAQEYRVLNLLKTSDAVGISKIKDQLDNFQKARSSKMKLAHWLGTDVMLIALDMAQSSFVPEVSARLLRMMTTNQSASAINTQVMSFQTGNPVQPLKNALNHSSELIRYWTAIAISRSEPSLASIQDKAKIVSLLTQAMSEVGRPTALVVSEAGPMKDQTVAKLEDLGYNVQTAGSAASGIQALRGYPSKDIVFYNPVTSKGLSLEFVNQLREDKKGQDTPLVILSDADREGEHMITFQETAQQMLLLSDGADTIRGKLSEIEFSENIVAGLDVAASLSPQALTSLLLIDQDVLRNYPVLVSELEKLIQAAYQPVESQLLAIRTLRKLGELAEPATKTLLGKLENSNVDASYKIRVLNTLLAISKNNLEVRKRLFEIVQDPSNPESFRQLAATYLSSEQDQLSKEERQAFRKSFYTNSFVSQPEG